MEDPFQKIFYLFMSWLKGIIGIKKKKDVPIKLIGRKHMTKLTGVSF